MSATSSEFRESSSRWPRWPGRQVGPLWVVTRGSGQALVLLHGNSQDHRAFDRVVPLLDRSGRMLVGIDSRAHGRSPRGSGPLTIASMADDVADVLDRLDLSGVDVLGFSDGGNIALELAIRHPGRARSLIVCGSNLDPSGLIAPVALEVRLTHRAMERVSRVVAPLRTFAERTWLMADNPQISLDDLGHIDVPVLVVAGQYDMVRLEHSEDMARALPRGELSIIPRVGHMIPRRNPKALADRVEDFLAGQAAP